MDLSHYVSVRDNAYVLASESCALDTIGAEFIRDVNPGEIVTITKDGIQSDCDLCLPKEKTARCIFEYIYFARPDSEIDRLGYTTQEFRREDTSHRIHQ